MTKDISYCAELLSDYERDNFFISLFAPAQKRDDVLIILSLNHELSKAMSIVKEPMMGKIRLQWWRDEIEKIYEGKAPAPQPVLENLISLRGQINKISLLRLIDFYDDNLVMVGFQRTENLKQYLLQKNSVVFDLIQEVLGTGRKTNPDLSLGWGLTEFTRHIGLDVAEGKHYIPIEILVKHGIDKGYITPKTEALKNVIKELHDLALSHLKNIKEESYLVLYKDMAELYLKEIEQKEFDIFKINPDIRPSFAEFKITFKGFFLKLKQHS